MKEFIDEKLQKQVKLNEFNFLFYSFKNLNGWDNEKYITPNFFHSIPQLISAFSKTPFWTAN